MSATEGPDWTVLEIDGVMEVAEAAARTVTRQFGDNLTLEYEDALQEVYLILATKPADARRCLEDPHLGLRVLHKQLCQDLTDLVKTEAGKRDKHESYERLMEGVKE